MGVFRQNRLVVIPTWRFDRPKRIRYHRRHWGKRENGGSSELGGTDLIYLDNNASTPVDPAVQAAMLPYFGEIHGNPSSSHALGVQVRAAIETARTQVATLLEAIPSEIVFTSSGTESNNHVIKGVAETFRDRGRHIVTSAVEHPAVSNPCKYLERHGFEVDYVGVDSTGLIDLQGVELAIRKDTILVSVMLANNEVGTIQPIAQIVELARKRGALVHTDAAQACGKIETSVAKLGVDFLSIAGHKLYAPLGIGALYIRDGVTIEPLHHGAGHQGGRRAGTEPVALIVGLGEAARLAHHATDAGEIRKLRDRLHDGLRNALGNDVVRLGHPDLCLPNTLSVGFRGKIGVEVMNRCPDICASFGAACHSGKGKRSAVLEAMDVPEEIAFGAVRFSVGRTTTEAEIDQAIELLVTAARAA